jgi:transposase-like protein
MITRGTYVNPLSSLRKNLFAARLSRQALTRTDGTPGVVITGHPQPYVRAVATIIPLAHHVHTGLSYCRGYTNQPVERSHVPTRDRLRGTGGLRTMRTRQRILEGFVALHALRRGTVKLRTLVPRYRPTRASMHETARTKAEVVGMLGTQLKKAACM